MARREIAHNNTELSVVDRQGFFFMRMTCETMLWPPFCSPSKLLSRDPVKMSWRKCHDLHFCLNKTSCYHSTVTSLLRRVSCVFPLSAPDVLKRSLAGCSSTWKWQIERMDLFCIFRRQNKQKAPLPYGCSPLFSLSSGDVLLSFLLLDPLHTTTTTQLMLYTDTHTPLFLFFPSDPPHEFSFVYLIPAGYCTYIFFDIFITSRHAPNQCGSQSIIVVCDKNIYPENSVYLPHFM